MNWDISPLLIDFGPIEVRWYGLLFASAFISGFYWMAKVFEIENRDSRDLDSILMYFMVSTLVGARLGHCLFYEPSVYLSNPFRILKIWEGGLASHGAAIGIPFAIWLFCKRKPKYTFLWMMDRLVVTVALGGALIRIGNFFNSEIVGHPTDLPWGVIFSRIDSVARHPAQLYESLTYFVIWGILLKIYFRKKAETPPGQIFGWFLILVFGSRFFIEFVKENQVFFEQGLILNMGQILSIPTVLFGTFLLAQSQKKRDAS